MKQTINNIVKNTDSSYSDEYLKQALANLGQRLGTKGDSLTVNEFKLKDIWNVDAEYYCFVVHEDTIDVYNETSDSDLLESINIFQVFNTDFFVYENIDVKDFSSNISLNDSLYKSICKGKIENETKEIMFFEYADSSHCKLCFISATDDGYNVAYSMNGENALYKVDSSDELDFIFEQLNSINSFEEKIDFIITGGTKINDDVLENKLTIYMNIIPKYNIKAFNDILKADNLKELKKMMLVDLLQTLKAKYSNNIPDYIAFINPNYNISIITSDDKPVIYSTLSDIIIELIPNISQAKEFSSDFNAETNVSNDSYIESYNICITYIDDEYVSDIDTVHKITYPYISTASSANKDVWYINGKETDISATGDNAGIPNIMIISYTNKTNDEEVEYTDIEVLHTYEDKYINKSIISNSINKENTTKFKYYLDYSAVSNSELLLYDFYIALPNLNELFNNKDFISVVDNCLLMTVVDIAISKNLVNGLTLKQAILGNSSEIMYLTIYWHVVKENNEYFWVPLYNPSLFDSESDRTDSPVLDLGTMIGLKNIVTYYANTQYSPDSYEHSWVVFDPVSTSIKQEDAQISGNESIIYPVFKVDNRSYYKSDVQNQFSNDLNFVPKFIDSSHIEKSLDSGNIFGINDTPADLADSKLYNIDDGKVLKTFKVNIDSDKYDYIPNGDENGNAYPVFDFKELFANNMSIYNRINLVSFDKDGNVYNGYIGVSLDGNKSILKVDSSDINPAIELSNSGKANGLKPFSKVSSNLITEFCHIVSKKQLNSDNSFILDVNIDFDSIIESSNANISKSTLNNTIISDWMPTVDMIYDFKIAKFLKESYPLNIDTDDEEMTVSIYPTTFEGNTPKYTNINIKLLSVFESSNKYKIISVIL